MCTRLALFLLVFVLAASTAHADPSRAKIRIYRSGIMEFQNVGAILDPSVPSGRRYMAETFKLLRRTTQIPARLGTVFGFEYEIRSKKYSAITITIEQEHPPICYPGKGLISKSVRSIKRPTNQRLSTGFGIDQPYKAVKGRWKFRMLIRGQEKARQEFTLY